MEIYEPMLAKLGSKDILERKNLVGYIFEPKFDGVRVLIYKDNEDIALFNRRKQNIIAKYPEFLDLNAYVKAKSCILDGELVILNDWGVPDSRLLEKRELIENPLKIKVFSRKIPATIFVFDVLELENRNLISEPLKERKIILKDLIEKSKNLVLCPYTFHGKDLWQQVINQELEGMIAKEINSKYIPGKRAWSWLKIRNFLRIDVVIAGFIKEKYKIKSLILALYDKNTQLFNYAGKVEKNINKNSLAFLAKKFKELSSKNSIFSEEEQKKISEKVNWLNPELVAEIAYKELLNKEIIEPEFLRLRFDKEVKDCSLEV